MPDDDLIQISKFGGGGEIPHLDHMYEYVYLNLYGSEMYID